MTTREAQFKIRVTEDVKRQFKDIATNRGEAESVILREALFEYLARRDTLREEVRPKQNQDLINRLAELIAGSGVSEHELIAMLPHAFASIQRASFGASSRSNRKRSK